MSNHPVILLELYQFARHGRIIRHYRRSDDDRPLCRKRFRVASPLHGWQAECAQCAALADQFKRGGG